MVNTTEKCKVGFIGLGAMGWPMAKNLAKTGCLHMVWNRTTEKARQLADELAMQLAESIADMTAEVDVIGLCVSADRDVLELVKHIKQTVQPGSIVIDFSTVSSETACRAAEMLAERQVAFIDAPVSGGVEGARNGTLVMMAGGDAAVLQKVMPLLESMTARVEHMGETGCGQKTKAVNQIMAAGINQAVTEALAFAQAGDLPMQKVIDVISGGAAGNWFLSHRGNNMIQGQFPPGFKVALHLKDLKICRDMAQQLTAPCPLTEMTIDDYQKLMQLGFESEDISALWRIKQS